ncbi:potassium channel family protein [Vibrio kyushuensis]|uniref:potassium channel family protein n=1 Tax=Vibrio kyushuensis TaxID=2910249 RepID=UPI003D0DEB4F
MNKDDIKNDTRPMSLLSLILSFMALFVISGLLFMPLNPETRQVLIGIDFVICSIFMLQLTIDLIRAANKMQYMKKHWIDFLASLPMIEPLRYARIFSILRIILIFRSGQHIFSQIFSNRRETTLASILLLLVFLLTVGSSMMLFIEGKNPGGNIKDGGDALWWALVTISTVGYGDHYPVTANGKILGSALIVCGVGIFGAISGLITSMITSPTEKQAQKQENKVQLLEEIVSQQQVIIERLERLEKQSSPPNNEAESK